MQGIWTRGRPGGVKSVGFVNARVVVFIGGVVLSIGESAGFVNARVVVFIGGVVLSIGVRDTVVVFLTRVVAPTAGTHLHVVPKTKPIFLHSYPTLHSTLH